MPRELRNAIITHVSLVDKGANKKQFAIVKSDKQPTFQKQATIIKADEEKQLVTGIVYEPETLDSHEDFMTAEEIEKAAHQFLQDYRQVDKQHNFRSGYGEVVESYVAKSEHVIGDQVIHPGTWVMTVKVDDQDTWEAVKKGEITGFSMAGIAEVIENTVEEESVAKSEEDEARGFFKLVKDFFSGRQSVAKGEVRDNFQTNKRRRDFWTVFGQFESIFYDENWKDNPDISRLQEAAKDMIEIMTEIVQSTDVAKSLTPPPAPVEKAGKKISTANMDKINAAYDALQAIKESVKGEETEVTKEELQSLIKGELASVVERVDALEKAAAPAEEQPANEPVADQVDTAAEIAKQVQEVLKAELEPITQRLDVVEKARGIAKAVDNDGATATEPVQKSVFGSLFGRE